MVGARKSITSRFKPTDIFARRLVITVPRSGIVIITIAILLGMRFALANIESVVSLVVAVVAVATTVEARHQLRTMRYEVVTRLNSTVATYQIPEEDLRVAHELGLIDDDDEDEGENAPRIWVRPTRHG